VTKPIDKDLWKYALHEIRDTIIGCCGCEEEDCETCKDETYPKLIDKCLHISYTAIIGEYEPPTYSRYWDSKEKEKKTAPNNEEKGPTEVDP